MVTSKEYKQNKAKRILTDLMIFQGNFSLECRRINIWRKKHRTFSLSEVRSYKDRYGQYEDRYERQQEVFSKILDLFGLRDGYSEYKREKPSPALSDLMSAQFISDLEEIIVDGEYEVIVQPGRSADNMREDDDRDDK